VSQQHPDSSNPRKPLVSVEFQTEIDLATARPERRMFVKMYFDARDSGLLADIGSRRWHTLCALATYIDEKGLCYPSQARLAKDLGIRREAVNSRIRELLAYRFQGRPIITVRKARLATQNGGRWANNVYEILPVTGFRIFGDGDAPLSKRPVEEDSPSYVRKTAHRPMSRKPHTGKPHTNENQEFNQTFNVNALKKTTSEEDEDDRRNDLRARGTALAILDVCGDHHSLGSYMQIARTYPEALIFKALSLTKDARARRLIRKSAGAYFTSTLIRLARGGEASNQVRAA
jgi:biotin operon repressor